MADQNPALSDTESINLVPDHIDVCSTCGYQAVKEHYPCMRCGQLGITRFVPEARVVVPRWLYEAWRRGFLPTPDEIESRRIEREARRG